MGSIPNISALLKLAKQTDNKTGVVMRAALLADTASQLLAGSLKGFVRHLGHRLDLFEAEFDQIEMQVFDPTSTLHNFVPEIVIVYLAAEKIAAEYGMLSVSARASFSKDFIERAQNLHKDFSARGYQTIYFNLVDPGGSVFGNYGNKVDWDLQNQVRLCNVELARMAQEKSDFSVFDLAALQAAHGRAAMFDPKLYYTSKFALTPGILPWVAQGLAKMLMVRKGSFLKCVILDLDNTLWGGVVADDGLERIQIGELGLGPAFTAFQSWLKQLRDRGIVLAVCSKNDDVNAREPFLKHPDMVLRLDDIAVFMANWNDKATNIRAIKSIIDVDYGAMMFLDDNPVERQLVRESFPTMLIPELSDDPTEYISSILVNNPFEVGSYTPQDAQRTSEYQVEARRHEEKEKYVDLSEFLGSLKMTGVVRGFLPFNIPRIAQLTQRSNQFNLRTARYSEKQILDFSSSAVHLPLTFELKDRFGDSGLIAVVILEKRGDDFFIDTWLMSCRVLGRGMEQFVLNTIMAAAKENGIRRVVGEFIPTLKNTMVKDHYKKLGFTDAGFGLWMLETVNYLPLPVHISMEKNNELSKENKT